MKLLRKIKIYHLTGNIKDSKVQKIIEFFEEIFSNMVEYYSNDYPKSIFYKYKDKIYFELDFKNDITRCKYKDFWRKFGTDFGLNYKETNMLIHYMLGTHFKREVPPTSHGFTVVGRLLGTHLKRKVLPTQLHNLSTRAKVGNTLKKRYPL